MSRSRVFLLAVAFAACVLPAAAHAQSCTFLYGPTALGFGAYDPAAATPTDSSDNFLFYCSNGGTRPTVSLSAGAGTFTQRQMTSGANRLAYNLYQDVARTIIWGDGTSPSTGLANASGFTLYSVYGRIFAGQWVAPGTYSDSIVVTLNY